MVKGSGAGVYLQYFTERVFFVLTGDRGNWQLTEHCRELV